MNKEKEDFFLHSNEVNHINREDYDKIELLVNAAKAFARSTYQCVYVIDYFHQDFIYASDNLAYLCGLEPEQLMEAGYQMYIDHVPDADLQMLLEVNKKGFDLFNEWPVGDRLDREVERNFVAAKAMEMENTDITNYIEDHVKMSNVLKTTMKDFDGGYVVCGITGSGEMFSMRDPWGIRPAFYYKNDEIVVVASERPVLQTTFDLEAEDVQELMPGTALLVKKNGECSIERIMEQKGDSACSFERIYFSRGSDKDIYKERKQLGEQLTQPILKAVDYDVDHTVFSYIPNTAEVAYYGMLSGFKKYLNETKIEQIANLDHVPSKEELYEILGDFVRSEKIAWKDIKLRTFITEGNSRNDLASHVYDVTYGSIEPNVDNLVIIDDSIVRGTTLKESILRILDRLHPKKIVVVSSAPQIRYPDYYGIDMARLEEFCVFRAAIQLLKERKMEDLIEQTYEACKAELAKPKEEQINPVRSIYKPFSTEEINEKIVEMRIPEWV